MTGFNILRVGSTLTDRGNAPLRPRHPNPKLPVYG